MPCYTAVMSALPLHPGWVLRQFYAISLLAMISCSGFGTSGSYSGGEDDTPDATDSVPPVLELVQGPGPLVGDATVQVVFRSSEAGTVSYSPTCPGSLQSASQGLNTSVLGPLKDGPYGRCHMFQCVITVTDRDGNVSRPLFVPDFIVDTMAPAPPVIKDFPDRTRDSTFTVYLEGQGDCDVLLDGTRLVGYTSNDGTAQVTVGPFSEHGQIQFALHLRDRAGNVSGPAVAVLWRYGHLPVCETDGLHDEISELWNTLKPYFEALADGSGDRPYRLYDLQLFTAPLLRYALNSKADRLLEGLAAVYLRAAQTLTLTDRYVFYYFPDPDSPSSSTHTLDRAYPMWVTPSTGAESVLVSSQFLYAVSLLVRYGAFLDPAQRPRWVIDFMQTYVPVLREHYARWIQGVTVDGVYQERGPFQVRGWGCRHDGRYVQTGMNHRVYTRLRLSMALGDGSSPGYCNAVLDSDLWIYAGLSNLLAAATRDPTDVSLGDTDFGVYLQYLQTASELLESRTSYEQCTDHEGHRAQCAFFDLGIWDDHADNAYTGYTGTSYPDASDARTASMVGWDISHARRFVEAFGALYRNAPVLGLSFPDLRFMQAMAAKMAAKVFLGDFSMPLFANFMDGTNGWYRVGYSGREGFGYQPSDLSISFLTGGYGAWMEYWPPLEDVFAATYDMLESTDPSVEQHVQDHYEYCMWYDYQRYRCLDLDDDSTTTSLMKLQYYSSICY